jgi:hypothetical protein
MAAQNVADGLITHRVPQVGQCSYNPVVAPAGILPRNSNHQALDPRVDPRPAGRPPLTGAVELGGYQLAIPAENGVGLGDSSDLLQ